MSVILKDETNQEVSLFVLLLEAQCDSNHPFKIAFSLKLYSNDKILVSLVGRMLITLSSFY